MKKIVRHETPITIDTPDNVFRYYKHANLLIVHRPDYIGKDGKPRHGKGVHIDLDQLKPEEWQQLLKILIRGANNV